MINLNLIQLLSVIGISGIISTIVQYFFSLKSEIHLKKQSILEDKYRSILIHMRCALKPTQNFLKMFKIENPLITNTSTSEEIKRHSLNLLKEIYYNNCLLYASDKVLFCIKFFVESPTELNYINTAMAMRKDLKNNKSKLKKDNLII